MLKRTTKTYLRSKVVSLLLVGTTSWQAMTMKMEAPCQHAKQTSHASAESSRVARQ